jgi:hypothetical protein
MIRTLPARLLEACLVAVLVAVPVLVIGPAVFGHTGLGLIEPAHGGQRYGKSVVIEVELNRPVQLPDGPRMRDTAAGTVDDATGGRYVELQGPWKAQAQFYSATPAQRLLFLGPPIVVGLTAMVVAFLLLRLLGTVRRGEPFVAANVRRLRAVAATIAIGTTVAQLLDMALRMDLLSEPAIERFVDMDASLSLNPLLAAVLVAAVAEILAVGTRLRAEVEGLV